MTVSILQSKLLTDAGFAVHGFTRRTGGVSEGPYASLNLGFGIGDADENVRENLRRLQAAVGTDLPLARVKQVHGAAIADVEAARLSAWDAAPEIEADAVISDGTTVKAVQTADCVPILLACPESRITAAVHAGWHGAAAGIVRNVVRKMTEMGARTDIMIASLGPAVGFPCYEVDEDVGKRFIESADPRPGTPGKFLLDLLNAVEVDLIISGISTDRMERVGGCTHCLLEEFFSYRQSGGTCGRMLGFIA